MATVPHETGSKKRPSKKPRWKCGMCDHINQALNRSRCAECGAIKEFGRELTEPDHGR